MIIGIFRWTTYKASYYLLVRRTFITKKYLLFTMSTDEVYNKLRLVQEKNEPI